MKEVGYQNLAADLRRIAMWMYTGNERLTEMFLEKGLAGFGTDKRMVKGKALADWLVELKDWRRDKERGAERALTLSTFLSGGGK